MTTAEALLAAITPNVEIPACRCSACVDKLLFQVVVLGISCDVCDAEPGEHCNDVLHNGRLLAAEDWCTRMAGFLREIVEESS